MSWINRPPWNHNINLLPCIAAGIYYQGNGTLQPSNSVREVFNYLEGDNRPTRQRRIFGKGCITQDDPYAMYITLEIDPLVSDLGEEFKFYQNQILVNGYAITLPSTTSFTITRDERFVFLFRLEGLNVIQNFLTLSSLSVTAFITKASEYLEESKILYRCDFTVEKGPRLDVGAVYIENNILTIVFNKIEATSCTCSTNCIPISGLSLICGNQSSSVQYRLSDSLNSFSFNLSDSSGNTKLIELGILTNVTPYKPFTSIVLLKDRQICIIAGNQKSSLNETLFPHVKYYQVERYIGSVENREIIFDWTDIDKSDHIIDETILPEKTYGYRIRYMGSYGDISQWSNWTTLESTTNIVSTWIDDEVYY